MWLCFLNGLVQSFSFYVDQKSKKAATAKNLVYHKHAIYQSVQMSSEKLQK